MVGWLDRWTDGQMPLNFFILHLVRKSHALYFSSGIVGLGLDEADESKNQRRVLHKVGILLLFPLGLPSASSAFLFVNRRSFACWP